MNAYISNLRWFNKRHFGVLFTKVMQHVVNVIEELLRHSRCLFQADCFNMIDVARKEHLACMFEGCQGNMFIMLLERLANCIIFCMNNVLRHLGTLFGLNLASDA